MDIDCRNGKMKCVKEINLAKNARLFRESKVVLNERKNSLHEHKQPSQSMQMD